MITLSKESIQSAVKNGTVGEWSHSDYHYFFARALSNKYQLRIHSYQLNFEKFVYVSSAYNLGASKAIIEKDWEERQAIEAFAKYFYWGAQPKIEKLRKENAPQIELVRCLIAVFYKSCNHQEPYDFDADKEDWEELTAHSKETIAIQFMQRLTACGYDKNLENSLFLEEVNAYLDLTYQVGHHYYLKKGETTGLLRVDYACKSLVHLEAW